MLVNDFLFYACLSVVSFFILSCASFQSQYESHKHAIDVHFGHKVYAVVIIVLCVGMTTIAGYYISWPRGIPLVICVLCLSGVLSLFIKAVTPNYHRGLTVFCAIASCILLPLTAWVI